MVKCKFSLAEHKRYFLDVVSKTDKKILAEWAIMCALRVMPYFEEKYPKDKRPQVAIETLRSWIKTGIFSMAVIRKASLDSHAAAREVGEDNSARSAARAVGQAVATAHVKTHSIGAAIYALQAIYRETGSEDDLLREREWQMGRLRELKKNG